MKDEGGHAPDVTGVYDLGLEEDGFKGLLELNNALAKSAKVERCVVKRFVEHAMGYSIKQDRKMLDQLQAEFRDTSRSYAELIQLVARSYIFQHAMTKGTSGE